MGVFDSGVGGLTVLAELRDRLPYEHTLYFGGTARGPYGRGGRAAGRGAARGRGGRARCLVWRRSPTASPTPTPCISGIRRGFLTGRGTPRRSGGSPSRSCATW